MGSRKAVSDFVNSDIGSADPIPADLAVNLNLDNDVAGVESKRSITRRNMEGMDSVRVKLWRWWEQNNLMILSSVGLLASSVGNNIFFKKMTNALPNYPFFLAQVTNMVYIPIFSGLVWYEIKFTRHITWEMRAFPKSKFFVMGLCDALAGMLMLVGGVHTTGSYQALLANTVIPVTMILSCAVLGTRFTCMQCMGALTILIGAGVVLGPSFLHSDTSDSAVNSLVFNGIFVVSTVPQAFSAVYKDLVFSDEMQIKMDVNYLQAWVAVWQLGLGMLLIPLNTLSFLGATRVSWSQLLPSLVNGGKCMAGINSITQHCIPRHALLSTTASAYATPFSSSSLLPTSIALGPCDACTEVTWVIVSVYLLFNMTMAVMTVLVIKHGSASLMYMVATLRLPLLQMFFSLELIQQPPDTIRWNDIVGLLLTMAGLVAYRWLRHEENDDDPEEADMLLRKGKRRRAQPAVSEVLRGGGASGAGGIDVGATVNTPNQTPQIVTTRYT